MWWLLLACSAPPEGPFVAVDDACWDDLRGEGYATQGADEAIKRYNCYRNFLGLSLPKIEPNLQEAAHAHARYMATNGTTGDAESPGDPDFTGTNSIARLAAAGYAYNYPFWPITQEANIPPADIVDMWVDDGFAREIVTTAGVTHAGFAQVEGQVSALLAFPLPSPAAPIVYPADDQVGVGLSYFDQPFGYPITVTVGSEIWTGDISNIYDLSVEGAELVGPDGDLDMEGPFLPGQSEDVSLLATAVFVPSDELEPGTTYSFRATVTWIDGTADVRSTFTTRP